MIIKGWIVRGVVEGRKVYVLEALDWRCNDGMPKVEL